MEEILVNSTIIHSIAATSQGLMTLVQVLVGGFVGLYIINIVLTYYSNRRIISLLEEIKESLHTKKKR